MNKREFGSEKEKLVAEYLKNKKYKILEMNYRVRQGEIDIIALEDKTYVFVEVKYRRDEKTGNPLEAVGVAKQKQISKVALYYMNHKKIDLNNTSIRFDVVGVIGSNITHIENAFDFIL